MNSKQYTIGEFAAINKTSTRMLRHYDKIGLLKPVTILPNGYRAYSSQQISALSRIKQFQGCGFSLSEIGNLLYADKEQITALAKVKQMELSTRDVENSGVYQRLCCLLGKQPPKFENGYAISYTLLGERLLFLGETPVSEEEIEASFDQLYYALDIAGVLPAGLPILLSGKTKDTHYRTAVPVEKEFFHDGFTCMVVQEGWYLSTLHFGDYNHIGAAYDSLLCHAETQKRKLELPFMEQYFLDQIHTANPNEYITEISVKITP